MTRNDTSDAVAAAEHAAFLERLGDAVPSNATLSERIRLFIDWGSKYFASAQLFRLRENLLIARLEKGETSDEDGAKLVECQRQQNGFRAHMTAHGPELVRELEARGVDSRRLLRFLHRVETGGGPRAAVQMWEDLKVELLALASKEDGQQELRVRAGAESPLAAAPSPSGAPISGSEGAASHGPRRISSATRRKRQQLDRVFMGFMDSKRHMLSERKMCDLYGRTRVQPAKIAFDLRKAYQDYDFVSPRDASEIDIGVEIDPEDKLWCMRKKPDSLPSG